MMYVLTEKSIKVDLYVVPKICINLYNLFINYGFTTSPYLLVQFLVMLSDLVLNEMINLLLNQILKRVRVIILLPDLFFNQ